LNELGRYLRARGKFTATSALFMVNLKFRGSLVHPKKLVFLCCLPALEGETDPSPHEGSTPSLVSIAD